MVDSTQETEALVLRARGGDKDAFSALIRANEDLMFATAGSIIPDPDAVSDVVQDSFLAAYERLEQLERPSNFTGWLRTIVRNRAISWVTGAHRRATYTDNVDVGRFAEEAETRHDRESVRRVVWDAVHTLPAMHREVVLAHYIAGYSQKEIAKLFDLPVTTVNGRLHQARLKLKDELGRQLGKEKSMTHARVRQLVQDAVKGGRYREALEHLVSFGVEEMSSTLPEGEREDLARTLDALMAKVAASLPDDGVDSEDWGEAPEVADLFGREEETGSLRRWIIEDRCRIAMLAGMGGIGKTSLAVHVSRGVAEEFTRLVWRSVINAPTPEDLLADVLASLTGEQREGMSVPAIIEEILRIARARRVLIVLDNVESLLRTRDPGRWRDGYEAYGTFLKRWAETTHISTLMLTGRERPQDLAGMSGSAKHTCVRVLELGGLTVEAGREILEDRGISGTAAQWTDFVTRYSGNPLVLKLVGQTVGSLFEGNLAAFLAQPETTFGGVREVLDSQFERLSPAELDVMSWLCVQRRSTAAEVLREASVVTDDGVAMVDALEGLRSRSLIERDSAGFLLQNVVMEYVTRRIVGETTEAVLSGDVGPLDSHPLMMASAPDYVRASQERVLLAPVARRLQRTKGREGALALLRDLLMKLREVGHPAGYVAGNVLNLAAAVAGDVNDWDFSGLTLRQAWLAGTEARGADFSRARFMECGFAMSFGPVEGIVVNDDNTQVAVHAVRLTWHYWSLPDFAYLTSRSSEHSKVGPFGDERTGTTYLYRPEKNEDGTLRYQIVDTDTKRVIVTIEGCPAMELSTRVGLVAVVDEKTFDVCVHDLATGELLHRLSGHTRYIPQECLAFSRAGDRLVSASLDGTARLWNPRTGECIRVYNIPTPYSVNSVLDDTSIVVDSWEPAAATEVIDTGTGESRGRYEGSVFVAFSGDGSRMVGADADGTVWVWDTEKRRVLRRLHGHSTPHQFRACFSQDGRYLVTGDSSPSVKLWDMNTGTCLKSVAGQAPSLSSSAISPDGKSIAVGDLAVGVRLYDLASGELLRTFRGKARRVWNVSFSPDGTLLAGGSQLGSGATMWDVRTGEVRHHIPAGPDVHGVVFSPDGGTLACVGDPISSVVLPTLWDVATGELVTRLDSRLLHAAFSPDGLSIAGMRYAGDERGPFVIDVINVSDGEVIMSLAAGEGDHGWKDRMCLFTSDGRHLACEATLGEARTTHVWELVSGSLVSSIPSRLVGFEDERTFLTRNAGAITRWRIGQDEPVDTWETGIDGATDACNMKHSIVATKVTPKGSRQIHAWNLTTGECLGVFTSRPPYEGMRISGAEGLRPGEAAVLKSLGALTDE